MPPPSKLPTDAPKCWRCWKPDPSARLVLINHHTSNDADVVSLCYKCQRLAMHQNYHVEQVHENNERGDHIFSKKAAIVATE